MSNSIPPKHVTITRTVLLQATRSMTGPAGGSSGRLDVVPLFCGCEKVMLALRHAISHTYHTPFPRCRGSRHLSLRKCLRVLYAGSLSALPCLPAWLSACLSVSVFVSLSLSVCMSMCRLYVCFSASLVVSLSFCLCVPFCLSVCLSVSLPLSVCLYVCMSVCLSVEHSASLSICRFSVCLSVFCLSVCLSVCRSVCLPVCPSVCLSDWLRERLAGFPFLSRFSSCQHKRALSLSTHAPRLNRRLLVAAEPPALANRQDTSVPPSLPGGTRAPRFVTVTPVA